MNNTIVVKFICEKCKGQLAIEQIQIDMMACSYMIVAECITCGTHALLELALEDFIELNKIHLLSRNQKPDEN